LPALLEVKRLTKIYEDGTRALTDVNFTIQRGEFAVLLGLSGSGKSTLLRCINRLVEPTEGQIIFDGQDVTAASFSELLRIRRDIGMIFQQFNLVKRSSVLQNVLSGRLGYVGTLRSVLGFWPAEDRERARHALKRVGIPEKAHNRADELSGGQQQRVGIARALMQEPKLVLADEPVASLDPVLSHSILRYLEALNKEDGAAVICSLHIPSLARRYATRLLALSAGRLMFDGLPSELDDAKFKEIYGQDAESLEEGPLA
jgi:phosphonate transport system ATP-binding protein